MTARELWFCFLLRLRGAPESPQEATDTLRLAAISLRSSEVGPKILEIGLGEYLKRHWHALMRLGGGLAASFGDSGGEEVVRAALDLALLPNCPQKCLDDCVELVLHCSTWIPGGQMDRGTILGLGPDRIAMSLLRWLDRAEWGGENEEDPRDGLIEMDEEVKLVGLCRVLDSLLRHFREATSEKAVGTCSVSSEAAEWMERLFSFECSASFSSNPCLSSGKAPTSLASVLTMSLGDSVGPEVRLQAYKVCALMGALGGDSITPSILQCLLKRSRGPPLERESVKGLCIVLCRLCWFIARANPAVRKEFVRDWEFCCLSDLSCGDDDDSRRALGAIEAGKLILDYILAVREGSEDKEGLSDTSFYGELTAELARTYIASPPDSLSSKAAEHSLDAIAARATSAAQRKLIIMEAILSLMRTILAEDARRMDDFTAKLLDAESDSLILDDRLAAIRVLCDIYGDEQAIISKMQQQLALATPVRS